MRPDPRDAGSGAATTLRLGWVSACVLTLAAVLAAPAARACSSAAAYAEVPSSPPPPVQTCSPCQSIAALIDAANLEIWQSLRRIGELAAECDKINERRSQVMYMMEELAEEIRVLEHRQELLRGSIPILRGRYAQIQEIFDDAILPRGLVRAYRDHYNERLDRALVELGEVDAQLSVLWPRQESFQREVDELNQQRDQIEANQRRLSGRIERLEEKLASFWGQLSACEEEECSYLPPRGEIAVGGALRGRPDSSSPADLPTSPSQYDFSRTFIPECDACIPEAKALNIAMARGRELQQRFRELEAQRGPLARALEQAEAEEARLLERIDRARTERLTNAESWELFERYNHLPERTRAAWSAFRDNRQAIMDAYWEMLELIQEIPQLQTALAACEAAKCREKVKPKPVTAGDEDCPNCGDAPSDTGAGTPHTAGPGGASDGGPNRRTPTADDLRRVREGAEGDADTGGIYAPPPPAPLRAGSANDAQQMLDDLRDQQRNRQPQPRRNRQNENQQPKQQQNQQQNQQQDQQQWPQQEWPPPPQGGAPVANEPEPEPQE